MRLLILLVILANLFVSSFVYGLDAEGGKMRIVLPKNIVAGKNKLPREMMNHANMTYVIQYDFDLEGEKLRLPLGCTLLFEGGSISNGELIGNKTTLEGSIKVTFLSGSFTNDTLRSSVIKEPNDYAKLKSILTLGVNNVVLDENFVITSFSGTIHSTSNVEGCGSTIILNTDIEVGGYYTSFLKFDGIQYFKNLEFNGNNHALLSVVSFVNEKNIQISKIYIHDIDSSTIQTLPSYCNCLVVSLKHESKIQVSQVNIKHIKSKVNGIIGDSNGNITGVLIQAPASYLYQVNIENCHFEELHNYKDGEICFEDVSCIYVSQVRPFNTLSKVSISNVSGYNFGKRLIKTDSCNVLINGVRAENYVPDVLTVIGLNDGNAPIYDDRPIHAEIRNVSFKGFANYIIASSVKNSIVENVESEITDLVSIAGNKLCSVFTGNTFSKVQNIKMRGAQLLFTQANFKEELNYFCASHIDYDDTMYHHSSYGNYFLCTFNGHVTLDDVKIKTNNPLYLFADNYPTRKNISESLHIKNIYFESLSAYSDGVFTKSENKLKNNYSISIEKGTFIFNGAVRWFMRAVYPDMIHLKDLNIYYNASNPASLWLAMDYKESTELKLENIQYQLPSESLDAIYLYNETGKIVECQAFNIRGNKNEITMNNVVIQGNFIPSCSKESFGKYSIHQKGMEIIDRYSKKHLLWNGSQWVGK